MDKIAVFPGSFDPITLGHIDIIERGLKIFDKIIIAIGINASKQTMFGSDRISIIREIYKDRNEIEVTEYTGLTTSLCQQIGAKFILRGIRNVGDFEYEKTIADVNKMLDNSIESVFLMNSTHLVNYSSSVVRELIKNNADPCMMLHSSMHSHPKISRNLPF